MSGLRSDEQNRAVKEMLGIPDHLVLLTVLPFGYRKSLPTWAGLGAGTARDLSEVAHSEQFGKPYSS